jgi:rod shape-determining protein MreD
MTVFGVETRRELEIRHFPILVYVLAPLAALVLQAWLPRLAGRYTWFDLPLVITVYFALGQRNPIQGTAMGALLGLVQDALGPYAIGANGIAKTVVGYLAASVGIRIDVENSAIRLIITFLLSLTSSGVFIFVMRELLGLELKWSWLNPLMTAVGNSVIALILFPLLDKLQIRE